MKHNKWLVTAILVTLPSVTRNIHAGFGIPIWNPVKSLKSLITYDTPSHTSSAHTTPHTDQTPAPQDVFFDTKILAQPETMKRILLREGFCEVSFTTPDGLNLDGLYLEKSDAQFNIVLCAGWLPGRKEGIATLYAMLPPTCNQLYFDARGHGKSEGPLFSNMWQYGVHEYKDIVGALTFMHKEKKQQLPTVIWGTCSGAFHAAHALAHLTETNQLRTFDMQGLFFDSGWSRPETAGYAAPCAVAHESIEKKIARWAHCDKKDPRVKRMIATRMAKALFDVTYGTAYYILYLLHQPYREQTNLHNKIGIIPTPIFFVHSKDDTSASFDEVKKLADKAQKPTCWWIDKSKHACHHLKHRQAYEKQLASFINSIIPPRKSISFHTNC